MATLIEALDCKINHLIGIDYHILIDSVLIQEFLIPYREQASLRESERYGIQKE